MDKERYNVNVIYRLVVKFGTSVGKDRLKRQHARKNFTWSDKIKSGLLAVCL